MLSYLWFQGNGEKLKGRELVEKTLDKSLRCRLEKYVKVQLSPFGGRFYLHFRTLLYGDISLLIWLWPDLTPTSSFLLYFWLPYPGLFLASYLTFLSGYIPLCPQHPLLCNEPIHLVFLQKKGFCRERKNLMIVTDKGKRFLQCPTI